MDATARWQEPDSVHVDTSITGAELQMDYPFFHRNSDSKRQALLLLLKMELIGQLFPMFFLESDYYSDSVSDIDV